MKKISILTLCLVLVPLLFGSFASKYDAGLRPAAAIENILIVPEEALPQTLERQPDTLRYCLTLTPGNAVGLTGPGAWEGAIRLTPTELGPYAGWQIIAICWYHYQANAYSQNVKVYDNGTSTAPGPVLTTEAYSTSQEEWVRVDLSDSVDITGTGDLWCAVEITQTMADYPIGVDDGPMVYGKGGWIYFQGGWHQLTEYNLNYNWCIMAIVAEPTGISERTPVTSGNLMFKAPTITRGHTEIEFTLPTPARVELSIYDATGGLCKTLISDRLADGTHRESFNINLGSGTYFYNLKTDTNINITRKFLLLK